MCKGKRKIMWVGQLGAEGSAIYTEDSPVNCTKSVDFIHYANGNG